MKDFKLSMLLSFIAGAAMGFAAIAFLLGNNGWQYCNACTASMDAAAITDGQGFNKFCYPSIYSNYIDTPHSGNTRFYPRTWLFAGHRDTRVCMQVMEQLDSRIVSF